MIRNCYNRIAAFSTLVFIVLVLTFAPFSPTFQYQNFYLEPNVAEAGGGGISCTGPCANLQTQLAQLGVATGNAASNAITAWATNALGIKEITLDGIAWGIINIILKEMIVSITAWVNAGFPDGGPSFVQDFGGFLKNIADGLVGDFIFYSGLGFICSPFQLDVQMALSAQYLFGRELGPTGYQPQCKMSEVIQNIQDFTINIDGTFDVDGAMETAYDSRSFASGGWEWWLDSSRKQENNVFGAYASAQAALNISLRNAKGVEKEILNWNKGFLNVKQCEPEGKNCKTVTPGTIIETQLNNALNLPAERLTVADEINELIGALLSQLAQQVLGGLGGMFGMSIQPFSANGNDYPSFLDALDDDTNLGLNYSQLGVTSVNNARAFIALQEQIIDRADEASTTLQTVRTEFAEAISFTSIPETIRDAATAATTSIPITLAQIAVIEALQVQYASTTVVADQVTILNDIIAAEADMPTSVDVNSLQQEIDTTLTATLLEFYTSLGEEITAAGGNPDSYLPEA